MVEEEIIVEDEAPVESKTESIPTVVRSEINFLQFPFFALSWRGLKNKKETVYRFVEERDGEKAELEWRVMASATYGHPSPFDSEVARAIDVVIDETFARSGYRLENPIPFSIYRLAHLMGLKKSDGSVYKRIKQSIERIVATTVKSKGSFFRKDKEAWVHDIFHLYDRVKFKGEQVLDDSINEKVAETNYLWLGDFYLRNVNARYVRPLDYDFLNSLKNPLSRRAYEVLSPKFYGLDKRLSYYHIDYQNYCQTLPVAPQKYPSDVRRQFKSVHKELGSGKFISKVTYVLHEGSKAVRTLRFYLGERARREQNGELLRRAQAIYAEENFEKFLESPTEKIELTGLAKELNKPPYGVKPEKAHELMKTHPDRIQEKIDMFDVLGVANDPIIENPAGWLIWAIETDHQPTEKQRKSMEAGARERAEEDRKERWREHRKELIEQKLKNWDDTPPEERIKGIFSVWQTTNPQHDSNSEEYKAKKQEYIDGLPQTEEERRRYIDEKVVSRETPEDFK